MRFVGVPALPGGRCSCLGWRGSRCCKYCVSFRLQKIVEDEAMLQQYRRAKVEAVPMKTVEH